MNKTTIDWPGLTHTLNPVSGCKRGCSYCYAARLHNKRHEAFKRGAKLPERYKYPFNEIHYWPETFSTIPKNPKKPTKIFIGSVSDICFWTRAAMQDTISVCESRPNIEFMFLTKDPEVYFKWRFPENSWLGCTCEFIWKNEIMQKYVSIMKIKGKFGYKTFLSLEPLSGRIGEIPKEIDLVIVGADSSPGAKPPKKEWIDSIKHPNIHYKANILKYMQGGQSRDCSRKIHEAYNGKLKD